MGSGNWCVSFDKKSIYTLLGWHAVQFVIMPVCYLSATYVETVISTWQAPT